MIKKIKIINNLGTFRDFKWNSNISNDFKRYNFIYGWNYSGKTTLSRLFRSLELKQQHPDFPDARFELETDEGDITTSHIQSHNLIIRVFNEEFIEENFKWNDENHRVNPVLILGKESIKLEKQFKEKEEQKNTKEKEKNTLEKENNRLNNELVNALQNKASEIRKILGIINPREFDRNNLEEKINNIKNNYKANILNDIELGTKLKIYRNQKEYEKINEINIDLKLSELTERTKEILSKKINAQQIIQKLKDNPSLNNWVRQGIDLHKNENTCQFCGNPLPDDLFEKLNKHFSKEFDDLIGDINNLEKEIENHIKYLRSINFTDKARFYEEYQQEYESTLNKLQISLTEYEKQLQSLLDNLKEKRNKPFDVIEAVSINFVGQSIVRQINEINGIIKKNNDKINSFSSEKESIKNELLVHYSAQAIDELDYFGKKKKIEGKTEELKNLEKEVEEIEEEIKSIKNRIIQANIGAEKINTYLKGFFGDSQLKLTPLDDGKHYQITRNNVLAKNLSTGERNIISLIYFITKLEENNFNLNDAIIFIDDPVSSLDSNHIFKVYGFLSEKVLNCKQLFITTHNFDFLNLLKDLIYGDPEGTQNKQSKAQKENFYLIKKIETNNQKYSIIENIPNILIKFRSEYNYLFSILKEFNEKQGNSDFEMLYLLPNIARRFLEAYLFQKYPDGNKFKDKCKMFLNNVQESEKKSLLKLIDEHSHEENPEHINNFPDINEVINIVSIILNTLKEKDKEHFDALRKSLSL
ncbi:MAG TPA: AAA family ATPase [Victivallales bacterium]|nr:AAA family ATPase [Victivallales bacterium]